MVTLNYNNSSLEDWDDYKDQIEKNINFINEYKDKFIKRKKKIDSMNHFNSNDAIGYFDKKFDKELNYIENFIDEIKKSVKNAKDFKDLRKIKDIIDEEDNEISHSTNTFLSHYAKETIENNIQFLEENKINLYIDEDNISKTARELFFGNGIETLGIYNSNSTDMIDLLSEIDEILVENGLDEYLSSREKDSINIDIDKQPSKSSPSDYSSDISFSDIDIEGYGDGYDDQDFNDDKDVLYPNVADEYTAGAKIGSEEIQNLEQNQEDKVIQWMNENKNKDISNSKETKNFKSNMNIKKVESLEKNNQSKIDNGSTSRDIH